MYLDWPVLKINSCNCVSWATSITRVTFFLIILQNILPVAALAMEIKLSQSARCVFALDGEIVQGDASKIISFFEGAVNKYQNGESTKQLTVCLNSPGGALVEGLNIARAFQRIGVGTVIESEGVCISACALIFMMGTAQGVEVAFLNRSMHKDAILGFHRPALSVPTGGTELNSKDFARAFDLALDSVVEFLLLANSTMPWSAEPYIESDLVQAAFAYRQENLYYIDTVEKAGRWRIDIFGYTAPRSIDPAAAYYACENLLHWGDKLQLNELDFSADVLSGENSQPIYAMSVSESGNLTYGVSGRENGYAMVSCEVEYIAGELKVCGLNEMNGITLGPNRCNWRESQNFGRKWQYPTLAIYKPSRTLNSLGEESQANRVEATCTILNENNRVADKEQCLVSIEVTATGEGEMRTAISFEWPTGSRTYLEIFDDHSILNGSDADRTSVDGYGYRNCYFNLTSKNTFCFSESP